MAEASYAVVFQGGILAGFDRTQVMQRFGELFGLTVEDVEKIFGHHRVVLKRNLDRGAADAYLAHLAGIGMAVSLDALHPPAPPPRPEPAAEPATAPAAEAADAQSAHAARPALAAEVVGAAKAIGAAEAAAAPDRAAGEAEAKPAERAAVASAASGVAARAAALAPEADAPRELAFAFSGEGFEFFRIWIVNILLGIITLGIYSAWAKVRTLRYFYGNTRIAGASFEYLADPVKILKGRLVAFALLAIYAVADQFAPLISAVLAVGFFAVFPWVMVRALAFRNHNSAWRGVRFGFDGRLGEAYKVFLLWPLLGMLSLGLLFPYAVYRQQKFVIGNSRYGTSPFEFGARAGGFYMIALTVLGVALAGGIAMALVSRVLPWLAPLVMVVAYLAIFALSNVMLANLRFNNTTLGAHALRANYDAKSYAMLMLTNTLAIGLTLGLFYPWAKVRSARYAAEHIALDAAGDLDAFAAAQRDEVSALGGEIGDLFDMDLGI